MDTVDMMISSSMSYYNNLKKDPNGRYRSWEHCYSNFYHAREKDNADVDYLSLQLAFYLASWGMYRGSSFLLQKDYRIHIPVIEELLDKKYDLLMGINCSELKNEVNQKKLIELNAFVSEYYEVIRKNVKEKDLKNNLSYTLITKIWDVFRHMIDILLRASRIKRLLQEVTILSLFYSLQIFMKEMNLV